MLISDLVQRYKADTLLLPHGLPGTHPVSPLSLVVRNKQLVLLQSFRVKNPCINRQDYASLVGKTKTQALKDINAFIGQGILRKYGTGRSVVYIKAK